MEVPGYLSLSEYRKRNGRITPSTHGNFNWEEMSKEFRVVAGTASTVAAKLELWAEEMGTNRIVLYPHIGNMPHWKVVRNLTMLAEEVIPLLRRRQANSVETVASHLPAALKTGTTR
jgi:alkanesulfonate monooxygenase SsuD/methylene tetrahydromethanopterin reductase-like flavin-dependent oxidoreductase (luciferase family)